MCAVLIQWILYLIKYRRMSRSRASEETDKQTRIAIVSDDKCKPKRCRQECKKSCPVVRMGKLCIEVSPNSKIASLSEELCIGCGICVKVRLDNHLIFFIECIFLSNNFVLLFYRNAHSMPLWSSMFQAIWKSKQRIDIQKTHLNCIDYQFHVPVSCYSLCICCCYFYHKIILKFHFILLTESIVILLVIYFFFTF